MSINKIIDIVLSIVNFFLRRSNQNKDLKRIQEDKDLADAIRSGDEQTVAKIREKRKQFPNLIIILIVSLCFTGCGIFQKSYHDVPLTEGSTPYVLPPGQYTDIHGVVHRENNKRWSLSEADLYRNSKPETINDPSIISSDKPKIIKPPITTKTILLIFGGILVASVVFSSIIKVFHHKK